MCPSLPGSTRRSNCGWFRNLGLGGIVSGRPGSRGEGVPLHFFQSVLSHSHPAQKPGDDADRWARLEFLLKKSAAYAQLLKQRMDLTLQRQRQLEMAEGDSDSEDAPSAGKRKRQRKQTKSSGRKKIKLEVDEDDTRIFRQPQLVTGTKLKDYQLEGVAWMAGLHENGISGILADDMGLGKVWPQYHGISSLVYRCADAPNDSILGLSAWSYEEPLPRCLSSQCSTQLETRVRQIFSAGTSSRFLLTASHPRRFPSAFIMELLKSEPRCGAPS